jgi:hypothetical protein
VQSIVKSTFCKDGLKLLDNALATAQHTEQELHMQAQAAGWLAAVLLRARPATATAVAETMLRFPSVPLCTAKQWVDMVAAGMRVTYAQLLAAAHSMVAGVEVWVQAQQQQGIVTDILQ